MKKILYASYILVFATSCKIQFGSDRVYSGSGDQVYKLQLNPAKGSRYQYNIIKETNFQIETDEKTVHNRNESNVSIYYDVDKDSLGNFVFKTTYNKIHIDAKNGDQESSLDAANAATTLDPAEKMLGILKDATIVAIVSPTGEQKEIKGYKELGAKVIENLNPNNVQAKEAAENQWENVIMKGLIKNNLDQLFQLFPDSAVHVGDKWKINTTQQGEVNLKVKTTYRLKDIENGLAVIESDSEIESDDSSAEMSNPTATLKGDQEGHYEMEANTGMLVNSKTTSKITGIIQTMGREVPVTIKSKFSMNGEKLK